MKKDGLKVLNLKGLFLRRRSYGYRVASDLMHVSIVDIYNEGRGYLLE